MYEYISRKAQDKAASTNVSVVTEQQDRYIFVAEP